MIMKKVKFLALGVLLSAGVMAQEQAQTSSTLTTKKGTVIFPQAGDYALGFDAIPVLNFGLNAVNIMNNTGDKAQHPGYAGVNQVLFGKYFLNDNLAVRARLGINTNNTTTRTFGDDPLYDGTGDAENILLSTTNAANSAYNFGAGLEWRRGHNRLQGYYGAEALLGFGTNRTNTKYEIAYNQRAEDVNYVDEGDSRTLKDNDGVSFMVGARGFVGVEYFVAPKISIGAEFGWGLGLKTTGRGTTETETYDEGNSVVKEVKGNTGKREGVLGVDKGAPGLFGGNAFLSLNFHF
jgi:hypothetical protein